VYYNITPYNLLKTLWYIFFYIKWMRVPKNAVAAIMILSALSAILQILTLLPYHNVAYAQQENRDKVCSNSRLPQENGPAFCAHLTVVKHVVGGTASASQFTMHITANNPSQTTIQGSESGTTITLAQGPYQVEEDIVIGYFRSYSPECSSSLSGPISSGETRICTITNTFVPVLPPPLLTVIKQVQGGTASPSDFIIHVTGNLVFPDQSTFPGSSSGTNVNLSPGSYQVTETAASGYTPQYSAGCSGSIVNGQHAICTITNIAG
jgi:Prealbumin-like fold domain